MLYYLVAALGMVYVLKYGTILESVRRVLGAKIPMLIELFHCSLCLGFWAGVAISPAVAVDPDVSSLYTSNGLIHAVLFPFASAAWCWTVDELHDAIVAWKNKD